MHRNHRYAIGVVALTALVIGLVALPLVLADQSDRPETTVTCAADDPTDTPVPTPSDESNDDTDDPGPCPGPCNDQLPTQTPVNDAES